MPGNIVAINNSPKLQWYVGDSKMEKLLKLLRRVGYKHRVCRQINKAAKNK